MTTNEGGSARDPVLEVTPLGTQWPTPDPFLFCAFHDDAYPAGDERLAPAASLAGRAIGQDFEGKDGWRMYHGDVVPGFPQHPHRGFETVTLVRRGLIDHSDSLGATARFGAGDVQWVTAGAGIVHSEMFPLVERAEPNPLELFQLWLNLPSHDKLVPPHFTMFWRDAIPTRTVRDAAGRETRVTIVAGRFLDAVPPAPPPSSWAALAEHDVAIWTLSLAPGATFTLPPAERGSNRALYFFRGSALRVAGRKIPSRSAIAVRAEADLLLENGLDTSELLLLQGRPIGEPVAQYGPFVMNTRAELEQAMSDYRRTRFGGWPWASDDPTHAREQGRFALRPNGVVERP
jgi:redox-sensitive bicupin YhaK (pirin superfamily)